MGPALLNIDYSNKRVINSRRICVYTLKNYLEKTANLSVLYCHTDNAWFLVPLEVVNQNGNINSLEYK